MVELIDMAAYLPDEFRQGRSESSVLPHSLVNGLGQLKLLDSVVLDSLVNAHSREAQMVSFTIPTIREPMYEAGGEFLGMRVVVDNNLLQRVEAVGVALTDVWGERRNTVNLILDAARHEQLKQLSSEIGGRFITESRGRADWLMALLYLRREIPLYEATYNPQGVVSQYWGQGQWTELASVDGMAAGVSRNDGTLIHKYGRFFAEGLGYYLGCVREQMRMATSTQNLIDRASFSFNAEVDEGYHSFSGLMLEIDEMRFEACRLAQVYVSGVFEEVVDFFRRSKI